MRQVSDEGGQGFPPLCVWRVGRKRVSWDKYEKREWWSYSRRGVNWSHHISSMNH